MEAPRYDYTQIGQPAPPSPGAPFPPGAPPRIHQRHAGWWRRNRGLAVAIGCLGSLLIVAIISGFVGAIVFGVFSLIRSSDGYRIGVEMAQQHPVVQQALGTPVEESWYVLGQVNENGAGGSAELQVPLRGPQGEGMLFISARKRAGRWRLIHLEFENNATRERSVLVDTPAPE